MTGRPPTTVVLATCDRQPLLQRALGCLGRQRHREFRVVVVDDGSRDDTWSWLEEEGERAAGTELLALRQENAGQGQARNLALRQVEAGLVVFIDDDILPRDDFLEEHLHAQAEHGEGAGIVGFTDWLRSEIRVTPFMEMVNVEGHQFGYRHMKPGAEVPFTCFYTSNLSLDRELLGEEPFSPAFRGYGWEDVELGYRLSRAGLRLIYHPAARADHLHRLDLVTFFDRQKQVGRGVQTLLQLHPELEGHPALSPVDPPSWFPVARRLLPPLVPLFAAFDRRGVPLARGLLHRILMTGYYLGQRERLETGA